MSDSSQRHAAQQRTAKLEASTHHGSSAVHYRQSSHTTDVAQRQLPKLTVSDVTPDVFRLVLEFAYSGSVQVLAPRWLKPSGAELLFEAAERYLLPLLKVSMLDEAPNDAGLFSGLHHTEA